MRTLGVLLPVLVMHGAVAGEPVDVGEAIFRNGILGSGKPLVATHSSGTKRQGADAACINCHRRSGLGQVEGRSVTPPVTARYLFRPRAAKPEDLEVPYVEGMRLNRDPYTEATLARALREGINSEGKPFSDLMPHFALNGVEMTALLAYLRQLDQRRVPGVSETVLHFATIITPEADPVKRKGMLDVLEHFFKDRNAGQRQPGPRLQSTHMMMFKAPRRWELHVWEVKGEPATWEQQLKDKISKEPVFAVLSGLGGKTWAPVHAFCEHAAVPCLFPNVEVPIDAERDFYSIYWSRGVLLEAQLIGQRLLEPPGSARIKTLHQVYRAGDSGEAAAALLAASLRKQGIAVVDHALARDADAASVASAVSEAGQAGTLVLWLRSDDIGAVGPTPTAATVYVSGLMGGLERMPLPGAWRQGVRIAYPFDLPDKRRVRVDYPLGWFRIRQIPVVDEQMQSDTYLACSIVSEVLNHVADTFVRDYLVERIEGAVEHRVITGYYPRLTLAAYQRFASKGGYIVRFADPTGVRVVADGDWIVP